MHMIADSSTGIGIHGKDELNCGRTMCAYMYTYIFERRISLNHAYNVSSGILALWLCLLQGLKYHTAEIHRKRAENQRQHNQLSQSINFLRSPRNSAYEPLSDDIVNYYNEYGDFDGKGPKSWTALRMKHDPCGDNWPDFLLSKIFLGVIGVSSVVVSSYFRFPEDYIITQYHNIFAIASLVQLFILALWILLIIRAAAKTGQVLRTEPFLR